MQMTPVRNDHLQNYTIGARNNQELIDEIDPGRVMEDIQSVYSTSQKSHVVPMSQQPDDEAAS